jgi:chromosome segregation ATPase
MAPASGDALLAHAAELERRDDAIAEQLEVIRALEERTEAVRARAVDAGAALERIPGELEELRRRRRDAQAEAAAARTEVERADARLLAALESGRRRRVEELERARKEAATAREALTDATARRERVDELEAALRADERALAAEGAELARIAAATAAEARSVGRIAEAAGREPGETFDAIDEWAAHMRSALLVARGTLETERERIVVEANVLGASVLGEELGTSSVALVRRRLEAHLAS